MNGTKSLILACMTGILLMAGASPVLAQPGGLHCSVGGRSVLPNGDGFIGQANINAVVLSAMPGSTWRHFEINASGTPEQIFIGSAESGACLANAAKTFQLRGTGALRGRSVEFEVFGRDRGPSEVDFYELTIRDSGGTVIYSADGNLLSGDIIAIIY